MNKSMNRRSFVRHSASLAVVPIAPWLATSARAAAWPDKPIRMICGFAPGGLSDVMARAYSNYLSTKLGQNVVVENKAGAGSILACETVARAPADGYTLLYTIQTALVQNQALYSKLPYDPSKDFTFISGLNAGRLPFCVHPSVPASNLQEFVAWAKGKPVNLGTYAAGSYPHMIAVQMNKRFGLNIEPVHYRGEAPMWQDVASGAIQAGMGSYQGVIARLQAASVKPIAVLGPRRMGKLPEVATFLEQGMVDKIASVSAWHAVLGPAGLPTDIRDRLSSLMVEAGKSDAVRKMLDNAGIDEGAGDWRELDRLYKEEGPVVLAFVKELGVKLD
jgi:tripartite-type tricarboxylate transporter receptor subunit TctC